MKPKDDVDLDPILNELGPFGRYQIHTYCFILVPILFSAVYNSQYIFAAADVDYRCQVPECESTVSEYVPGNWSVWALPRDKCARMTPTGTGGCGPDDFNITTQSCSDYVYENYDSMVSEFDLACQDWKRTLVGTIHSAGLFAALPLTGYVSDAFGRRTAFILTAMIPGVIGFIRSFSPNYTMYLIFEFLDATLGSGVYSTGFILALEMVGLKYRVLGGNIISCTYAFGQVTVALVAWAIPEWRLLTRVIYLPSLLFVFYYFFVEESVRWLLSNGDKEEAARIIFKAAEVNNRKLSPETIKQLTVDSNNVDQKKENTEQLKKNIELEPSEKKDTEPSLFIQVVKSKILMSRLAICSFWWITVTFIYYGLSINSVSLSGNKYINYILTSLVEIPGYGLSVITLDRFGRKSSIMTAFYICGISLISLPFVPNSVQWVQTSLTMLGKLCISMAFSSIYIYTSELFPTNARHRLLGLCSMFGRVGSLVAPQTPLLMKYMESLPYLVFGVMAGAAGTLMLLTPETLNLRLPDTVRQAENIVIAPKSAPAQT